jgi:hypothetical protein
MKNIFIVCTVLLITTVIKSQDFIIHNGSDITFDIILKIKDMQSKITEKQFKLVTGNGKKIMFPINGLQSFFASQIINRFDQKNVYYIEKNNTELCKSGETVTRIEIIKTNLNTYCMRVYAINKMQQKTVFKDEIFKQKEAKIYL